MKYHWFSNYTGEIVSDFREMVKTTYWFIKNYKFSFKMLNWKYSKRGF